MGELDQLAVFSAGHIYNCAILVENICSLNICVIYILGV